MQNSRIKQSAFTLVEMLVVAPMIILLIGAMIAFTTTLTSESLRSVEKTDLIFKTQDALATIKTNAEYDLTGAISTGTTTGPLNAPQGINNGTAAFTTNTDAPHSTLVLKLPATTMSRYNYGRSIIYAENPTCATSITPYPVYHIYFVKDSTLYERTTLSDTSAGNICNWWPHQRLSCESGQSGTWCQKEDEILATDVKNFALKTTPNGLKLTLTLEKTVAGEIQSYESTIFL